MIVAVNTIRIKSGHIDEVAKRFMNPKGVTQAPGFLRMELWKETLEEHDELKVCTSWESREAFDGWVGSDAFKQAHAHARPQQTGSPASGGEGQGDSGHPVRHGQGHGGPPAGGGIMLGAKLSVHEVLYTT